MLHITPNHSRLKKTYIASIVMSIFVSGTSYATEPATGKTTIPVALAVFNNNDFPSDLEGSLEASVSFAQSQIMPSKHGVDGDIQPYLTAQRTSLLLIKPKRHDLNITTPFSVTAIDNQGRNLGTMRLNPPSQLPITAYAIDGIPEGDIDFSPVAGPSTVISSAAEIAKLNDPSTGFLQTTLTSNNLVDINTANGIWTRDIYLPNSESMTDKVVRVTSKAGYSSNIHYSGRSTTVTRGNTLVFNT